MLQLIKITDKFATKLLVEQNKLYKIIKSRSFSDFFIVSAVKI